jgi:hypothetical protein
VALAWKAPQEIIVTFYSSFIVRKINELVVTSKRLINSWAWLQVVIGWMWPSGHHLDHAAVYHYMTLY